MKHFSIILFISLITGCARGPSYESMQADIAAVNDNQARLVFFRPKGNHLYMARKASIDINDDKTGACAYGGFFYRDIAAGEHSIKADMWDIVGDCEVTVNAKAGATYYFKVGPRLESFTAFMSGGIIGNMMESSGKVCGGAFKLSPTRKKIAKQKMVGLKLSD